MASNSTKTGEEVQGRRVRDHLPAPAKVRRASEVALKRQNAVINRSSIKGQGKQGDPTFLSIPKWINLFKIFIIIGVIIFTIGQMASVPDTDLAAYIWFGVGVLITWVLAMREISAMHNEQPGWTSAFKNLALMLPTLGTLLPLGLLIGIMIKIKPIVDSKISFLPKQYFWFNKLTFFLVVLQMFVLYKFFDNVRYKDMNRSLWTAAIILASVLTSAAAIELYVIVTSFITDG